MTAPRFAAAGALAILGSLLLSSCAVNEMATWSGEAPGVSGMLTGSGSSSQEKAQSAWIAEFQNANPALTINYSAGGSGVGRTAFIEGAADFVGSDRPYTIAEIAEHEFASCAPGADIVELPLYISPLAIAFNLPGIDTLNLDAETVARIFSNRITSWDDPAIAALNPGIALPSRAITPVFRSTNSGTTENFTDYLSKAAPRAWPYPASGDWPTGLTGEASAETGDIAAALEYEGTIGYLDASRAPGTTVAIKVGTTFVPPTPEAAAAVIDASPLESGRAATDVAVAIDRATEAPGAYPLVLVSYAIGCTDYRDATQGALVRAYFDYLASAPGQAAAAAASGSAPISEAFRERLLPAIAVIR